MGKIVAVCVSEKKGIQKRNIGKCKAIKHYGLEGDAHAGKWHRQVSLLGYTHLRRAQPILWAHYLLAYFEMFRRDYRRLETCLESADVMRNKGLEIKDGDFGENIVTSGIELKSLPVGTTLKIGNDILIRVTQIGKLCHDRCAIYYKAGDCIMPREGIFAEILNNGIIATGDEISILEESVEK